MCQLMNKGPDGNTVGGWVEGKGRRGNMTYGFAEHARIMAHACGVHTYVRSAIVYSSISQCEKGVFDELACGQWQSGSVGWGDVKLQGVEEGGMGQECTLLWGD